MNDNGDNMKGDPKFDKDGLPLYPIHARFDGYHGPKRNRHPDWWYYEERGGITIYHDGRACWIPVAQLRKYLERHDAA